MKFSERIAKLFEVKSIITIVCTAVFAYLAVVGKIDADKFLTIFTMVISFYFGTRSGKSEAIAETTKATTAKKKAVEVVAEDETTADPDPFENY